MTPIAQMEGQKRAHTTLVDISLCRCMAPLIQASDYLRHLRTKQPFSG
jgi:hypothetical protein